MRALLHPYLLTPHAQRLDFSCQISATCSAPRTVKKARKEANDEKSGSAKPTRFLPGPKLDALSPCPRTNSLCVPSMRHCPKCQSLAKLKWLDKQKSEILPVGYFHLVFTLPHELNGLILTNKKILLSHLFKAVGE